MNTSWKTQIHKLFSKIAVPNTLRYNSMLKQKFQVKLELPSNKKSIRFKIFFVLLNVNSGTIYNNLEVIASKLNRYKVFRPTVNTCSFSIKTYYSEWL